MQYLNFSKKERRGTFTLLVIIFLLIIIPFLLPFLIPPEKYDAKNFASTVAKIKVEKTDDTSESNSTGSAYTESSEKNYVATPKIDLFYFDPNTLSAEGWKKLGVRDKTIMTIQKYLSKAGKFYKPEDISKIWGFRKEQADKLIPYIKIVTPSVTKEYSKAESNVNEHLLSKKYNKELVDINTADTTAFISLNGIASKLANRIIIYRNKLGGFYSVEQIGEVFGLRDSIFQLLKPRLIISNIPLVQFNINTATADEMKTHPYIHYAIANAIVQYRTQHGNYSSIADIKKIMLLTTDDYNKMAPYLKIN